MEQIISTPRLKLKLITQAGSGSTELAWLHTIYSDEKATFWSIYGRSQSLADTEKAASRLLASTEDGVFSASFAVHKLPGGDSDTAQAPRDAAAATATTSASTEFIGLVTLRSVSPANDAQRHLDLPAHLASLPPPPPPPHPTVPSNARFSGTTAKKDEAGPPEDGGAGGALTVEVAYMFLPGAWGRGFATEAVSALLLAASASSLLLRRPLYVRAIVNGDNAASMRVMDKVAVAGRRMSQRGIYHWAGEPIFHGGRWRAEADLWVYGMYLVW